MEYRFLKRILLVKCFDNISIHLILDLCSIIYMYKQWLPFEMIHYNVS